MDRCPVLVQNCKNGVGLVGGQGDGPVCPKAGMEGKGRQNPAAVRVVSGRSRSLSVLTGRGPVRVAVALVSLALGLALLAAGCLELDWGDDSLDLLDGSWQLTTISGDGFNHTREVMIIVAGNTVTMVPVLHGEPVYGDAEGGYVSGSSDDFTIVIDLAGPPEGVSCVEGVISKEFTGWVDTDTLEGVYEEVRVHRGESCSAHELVETLIPDGTFSGRLLPVETDR